jgi:hypothetical protein
MSFQTIVQLVGVHETDNVTLVFIQVTLSTGIAELEKVWLVNITVGGAPELLTVIVGDALMHPL